MYSLELPRQGSSNEYPQSMFLSRNTCKKNNVCPCKPQFYYIKVRFKGVKLYRYVFMMYICIRATFLHFRFVLYMQTGEFDNFLWLIRKKICTFQLKVPYLELCYTCICNMDPFIMTWLVYFIFKHVF